MNGLVLYDTLIQNIFSFLDNPCDILNASRVCKMWYKISKEEVLWKKLCLELDSNAVHNLGSWKERFTIVHNKKNVKCWEIRYLQKQPDFNHQIPYHPQFISSADGHLHKLQGIIEKDHDGVKRNLYLTNLLTGLGIIIHKKELNVPEVTSTAVCYPVLAIGYKKGGLKVYDLSSSKTSPITPIFFKSNICQGAIHTLAVNDSSVVMVDSDTNSLIKWDRKSHQIDPLFKAATGNEFNPISTIHFVGLHHLVYTAEDIHSVNLKTQEFQDLTHYGVSSIINSYKDFFYGSCSDQNKFAYLSPSGKLIIWELDKESKFNQIKWKIENPKGTRMIGYIKAFETSRPNEHCFRLKMQGNWVAALQTHEKVSQLASLKIWDIRTQKLILERPFFNAILTRLHMDDHRIVVEGESEESNGKIQKITILDFSVNPIQLYKNFKLENKTRNPSWKLK